MRQSFWRRPGPLFVVALLLSACGGRSGLDLVEGAKRQTSSPYLPLFHEHGFNLPDNTQITKTFEVTLGGVQYEVLEYRTTSVDGLQIKYDDVLLADPEIAFDVLLSYAWTAEHHGMSDENVRALNELEAKFADAEREYQAFFEFAEALTPVIAKIEELKDHQISGIPQINIGPLPIIDITNRWDLICHIPLDIFDLCLLEPLLQQIHKQGLEIEQLLQVGEADLAALTNLLEAQARGESVSGLALKEAAEKAITSLNNLLWKLDEFATQTAELQLVNLALIDGLENQLWGDKVGRVISFLENNLPGFKITSITDPLLSRLKTLDQKMSDYLQKADQATTDIEQRLDLLTQARLRTDEALMMAGERWRVQPN